jgi:hypothetical protein
MQCDVHHNGGRLPSINPSVHGVCKTIARTRQGYLSQSAHTCCDMDADSALANHGHDTFAYSRLAGAVWIAYCFQSRGKN